MAAPNLIISESDYARFLAGLKALGQDANAKFVFLLDRAGQQVACYGNMDHVDATSLASLTAGNVAATEGVAQLVGEDEFTSLFHEGKHDSLHISVVGNRLILLVVFDERSSLGLVRLRLEQHSARLGEVLADIQARSAATATGAPAPAAGAFSEITEEDIDALFG